MKRCCPALLFLLALPVWADPPGTVALGVSAKPEPYWSFWRGETAAGYRQKLVLVIRPLLQHTASPSRVIELTDAAVPDQLNRDRAPWHRHQALCRDTGADVLLSLRVEDAVPVFSPWQADLFGDRGDVPSAHWPNLYSIAFDCKSGSRLSEHSTLSPRIQDRFVFETDLLAYTRAFWGRALTHFSPGHD